MIGYTNASWTLKADIASIYFTKLLNHMRSTGLRTVVARSASCDPLDKTEISAVGRTRVCRNCPSTAD